MFRFQFILTALASMALSFALRTSLWRPRFRRSLYSSIREETAATTAIHHHNNNEDQNIFLVEFRGIHPVFRCDEFRDAYHQVLLQSDSAAETTAAEKAAGLVFTTFIPDLLVPSIPAVAFVHLPIGEGEETAQAIARRCSLVRSVVKVWGQGITAEDTATQTVNNFPTMIAPIFSPLNNRSDNSWKVSFRRYGRGGKSGLDPQGKWSLLQSFAPVLLQLHGDVSMKEAKHELLFLEDWSSFRVWDDERIAREKAIPPLVAPVLTVTQTSSISSNSTSTTSSASSSSASSDRYSGYIPLKSIFGRVICEGPNIITGALAPPPPPSLSLSHTHTSSDTPSHAPSDISSHISSHALFQTYPLTHPLSHPFTTRFRLKEATFHRDHHHGCRGVPSGRQCCPNLSGRSGVGRSHTSS